MKVVHGWLARTARMGVGLVLILTALAGVVQAGGPVSVPEIDPGTLGSALTLLLGGALVITGRSRKG